MSSDAFIPVGPAADIPDGEAATVDVGGGIEVAVFNAGGQFFALENYCPHQGARLSDGGEGHHDHVPVARVVLHLADGTMTLGSYAHVDPYDLKIEDGQISVSPTPRPKS